MSSSISVVSAQELSPASSAESVDKSADTLKKEIDTVLPDVKLFSSEEKIPDNDNNNDYNTDEPTAVEQDVTNESDDVRDSDPSDIEETYPADLTSAPISN